MVDPVAGPAVTTVRAAARAAAEGVVVPAAADVPAPIEAARLEAGRIATETTVVAPGAPQQAAAGRVAITQPERLALPAGVSRWR